MVSCWAGWIWCLIYFHLHSLSWYNILSLSWGQKGFFFLMIHIFASAPLPPLSFSFSPPSSLFLSSLLVLCRPAAETGCVTSLKAGAVPWLEQEGEKNGEKIRRWVRPHVSFAFSNVPLSSDHVCVSMCVCVCAQALSLHCCRSALPVQRILCNVGSPGPARSQCCRENTGENRVQARLSPPRCARLLSRASVWIKLDSGPRLVCICVRACRGVRGCEITFGGAARPHPLDRLLVVDPCAVQNVRIKDRQRRMIQWLLSRRWRLSGDSYMQLFRDRSETLAGLGL